MAFIDSVVNKVGSLVGVKRKDRLVYRANGYRNNYFAYEARRYAMMKAERVYKKKMHDLLDAAEKVIRKSQDKVIESKQTKIIENGRAVDSGLGEVLTSDATPRVIVAVNQYGEKVPEALMIYYRTDDVISVTEYHGDTPATYATNTICFWDCLATVTASSDKNLILTQVQGRDYSRKELVSGGDVVFNVSGEITSNYPGVYPEDTVKKFIQMMQYGGIIEVNHYLFRQYNIKRILVQSFELKTPEFKNIQPYSFKCVGIEPDVEVSITSDTISLLNKQISNYTPQKKTMEMIVAEKARKIAENQATYWTAEINQSIQSVLNKAGL